jgi:hypothetical protein
MLVFPLHLHTLHSLWKMLRFDLESKDVGVTTKQSGCQWQPLC